jgi:hypothetical protein
MPSEAVVKGGVEIELGSWRAEELAKKEKDHIWRRTGRFPRARFRLRGPPEPDPE